MFNPIELILVGGIFLSVACCCWLLLMRITPDKWQQRVDSVRGIKRADATTPFEQFKKLAQRVGAFSDETNDSALRRSLVHAGYRDPSAPAIYAGARVLLLGFFLVAAWLIVPSKDAASLRLLYVVVAGAAGFYIPKIILTRKIEARQLKLATTLPAALDLMTIAVDAGLGLDVAMMRTTQRIGVESEALRWEFEATWMEIQAGIPRAQALINLADRTGVEDIRLLVTLLNSAEQLGVAVGTTLRNFSATLRLKRQQRAEELAAKVPLKLLFPLVFLMFPVLIVELAGPAGIQISRAFASMQGAL